MGQICQFAAEMTCSAISSIEFPEPDQLRSRRIVTRSRARATGKYPSWKMGRMLQWKSVNELLAFRLLDCDPEVKRFNEQPCEIVYVQNGVAHSHFPDILVEMDGLKQLWEVKPESEALRPEIASRSALLVKELPKWGYSYRVVIGQDLAKQPRLGNAIMLLGFGRAAVSERDQELIRLTLQCQKSLLWSEACSGVYGPKGREILCGLALRGALTLDMNAPWSRSTRFSPGKVGI